MRHATTAAVGHALSGRAPGVSLGAAGRAEAAALGARLARRPVAAVHASPMARTLETAAAIARPHGLPVHVAPGLVELDVGAWTGAAFDALAGDAAWGRWNAWRSIARTPGGEGALGVQARAVAAVLDVADAHGERGTHATPGREGPVVLVTHADVLRAVLGHFLGIPLDLLLRLEVAPASISEVEIAPWGVRVLRVNDTGVLPGTGDP